MRDARIKQRFRPALTKGEATVSPGSRRRLAVHMTRSVPSLARCFLSFAFRRHFEHRPPQGVQERPMLYPVRLHGPNTTISKRPIEGDIRHPAYARWNADRSVARRLWGQCERFDGINFVETSNLGLFILQYFEWPQKSMTQLAPCCSLKGASNFHR